MGDSLRSVGSVLVSLHRGTCLVAIGDIFMIRVLNQDIIVINSKKIAKDLLDRRSSIYSDRPFLAMRESCVIALSSLILHTSNSILILLGMAGPSTLPLNSMEINGVHRGESSIKPLELKPVLLFVLFSSERLVSSSWIFSTHLMIIQYISKGEYHSVRRLFVPNGENVFRFAAAVIMSIVYDYDVAPDHDHLVELLERGSELSVENLTPETAAIVEAFPFGKWPPFIGFSL